MIFFLILDNSWFMFYCSVEKVFKISTKKSSGFRRILEWKKGVLSDFCRTTNLERSDWRGKNCTNRVILCSYFRFSWHISCVFWLVTHIFKHAKFSKVNAFWKFGVDFFKRKSPEFSQNVRNSLFLRRLSTPLKNRLFSDESLLVQNSRVFLRVECSIFP